MGHDPADVRDRPLIRENTGAQLGAVIGQTRISPVRTSSSCSTDVITRAGPSADAGRGGEAAQLAVAVVVAVPPCAPSHCSTMSVVMPHSITVAASVTASGGYAERRRRRPLRAACP